MTPRKERFIQGMFNVVPTVSAGAQVTRGQQIGTIYGYSLSHLHFEIRTFMAGDGTGDPYPTDCGGGYYSSTQNIDAAGYLHPTNYINAHRPGTTNNLCGNLGGRTLTPGTYTVTCDIRVDAGQSLVIQSGAVLNNFDNYSFTVNGSLTWYP